MRRGDARTWEDVLTFAVCALLLLGAFAAYGRSSARPPADQEAARVEITLFADGDATVRVVRRGDGQERLAADVARAVFPEAEKVTNAAAAGDSGRAVARRVFPVGREQLVDVYVGYAAAPLRAAGVRRLDLRVSAPTVRRIGATWSVPPADRGYRRWEWRGLDPAALPAGVVRLRADPGAGVAGSVVLLAGFALAFAAICRWPRRRNRWRVLCGVAGTVLPLVAAGTGSPDDLGVAGTLTGRPLAAVVTSWPWLLVASFLLGLWLVLVPVPRRRRGRGVAPSAA